MENIANDEDLNCEPIGAITSKYNTCRALPVLASATSAYDRYVIRKSKNLSLVGCFLLSQLQDAVFVTFPRTRLLNMNHLARPFCVRKKPYRVQGGAHDDSRCHTRVCIVCQIPMLCCTKARLLFSCEETPTTTRVSRLSVYAIASIMKQLLIFGRERVLFL